MKAPIAFSALRVFAIWRRNYALASLVFALGLVVVIINMVRLPVPYMSIYSQTDLLHSMPTLRMRSRLLCHRLVPVSSLPLTRQKANGIGLRALVISGSFQ